MKRSRLLVPAFAAVALAALAGVPLRPPSVLGQTIPLRPTATAVPGAFAAAPQPSPPPLLPPSRPTNSPPTPATPSASATPSLSSPSTAAPSPTPAQTSVPSTTAVYRVEHVSLSAESLPAPPAGWRPGGSALRVIGSPPAGAAAGVTILITARDLASAGGIHSGLAVFALDSAGQWARVAGQSVDPTGRLTFTPPAPGVYAVFGRVPIGESGDYSLTGGRFFRTGPAGGFSVLDGIGGPRAAFWSVYTALGGEVALGRPVSRRFESDGQLLQVFERGIIASDARTSATARLGAAVPRVPSAALEPEPPPLSSPQPA